MIAHADRRDQDLSRDELLEKYAGFAHSIAIRWQQRYPLAELDDLHAEVVYGFLQAADRYDRSKPFRFGTYASWWALRYLRAYVANVLARGMHIPSTHGFTSIGVIPLARLGASDRDDDWQPPQPEGEPAFEGGEWWWANVLRVLPDPRDRRIVRAWAEGSTLASLSARFGLSKERIRQIKDRSLRRIREKLPQLETQIE